MPVLGREDICPVPAADICPVSTADICPVPTEDIYPVSTEYGTVAVSYTHLTLPTNREV